MKHRFASSIVVFICSFIFLSSWAISNPVGSSPDEGTHLVNIWCTKIDSSSKCINADGTPKFSSELSGNESCYLFDAGKSASCLEEQEEVFKDSSGFPNLRFYAFFSNFISDNIALSVIIMRLVNVLILTICITLAFIFLKRDILIGTLLSFMTVGIPLGTYLATSINTSSWLILGSIFLIPFLLEIFTSWRISLIPIVIMSFILIYIYTGSRQDGILFLSISIVSAIPIIATKFLSLIKNYWNLHRKITSNTINVVFIFINIYLIYFISIQISARADIGLYASTQQVSNWDIAYRFTSIISGALGNWGLGSLEVTMPDIVRFCSIVLFFSILFVSLKYNDMSAKFALLLNSYFLIFIIWIFLYKSQLYVGQWLQPRYIIPLMFSLISLSFVGISHEKIKLITSHVRLWSVLSTIGYLFSLHTLLRRYTHGLDEFYVNLNTNLEWWWSFVPISPMTILGVGTVSYLTVWALFARRIRSSNFLI